MESVGETNGIAAAADAAMPGRVLMTADCVGGVWTYTVELAAALGGLGIEVLVATMGAGPRPDQRRQIRALPNAHLAESGFKLEWMEDPWRDLQRAGLWLLELEQKFAPDVIHLNGYVHGALPWTAPAVVVAHSCVLSRWRAVHGGDAPHSWHRYRREVRRGIAAASMLVAPSSAMLEEVHRYYGAPRAERLIPNARDARLFRVGHKQPFVFSFGRVWDEAKNMALLGPVAESLAWPVYAAGEYRHPEKGSADLHRVNLLGVLGPEALAAWLSAAPICALPARYEPFGLAALEAALSGCALVLGDIPSLRENWDDAAVFVAPGEWRALAREIQRLIENDRLRRGMGERARMRALEFNPARMANAYAEAYRSLLPVRMAAAEESQPCAR